MLIATVSYGRGGYRLEVADAPLWALVVEEVALAVCCEGTGHPLCRGIGPFGFGFGQRLLSMAARRELPRWSAPITEVDVRAYFPEKLIDLES